MSESIVKCQICGVECDGDSALIHWEQTGHNSWELILPPSGVEEKNKCF